MAYVIHVQNTDASCGSSAKIVDFVIDGIRMPVSVKWDNSGARQVDLALVSGESSSQVFIPFIVR